MSAEKTCVRKKMEFFKVMEETVCTGDNYILGVCGTQSEPEFRIATSLSNYSCIVHSIEEKITQIASLTHFNSPIIGAKFSSTSKNILYIGCNNGQIVACDLRAKGKIIAEFQDDSEDGKIKPLASFDISNDDRLLAGGTEHVGGDAFILFWDLRNGNSKMNDKNNILGGYWESHMDDVTCLTFHPKKKDILASGSTDGLINIFDLTQSSEDTALSYSLNTESSVDRIGWLNNDSLWCTTHTHTLQLWDSDGATPCAKFDRSNFAMSPNEDLENSYIVKVHTSSSFNYPFLLAGSNCVKRQSLLCLNIVNNKLESCPNLIDNTQIVRDSWLHEKSSSLVTVGESGILNVWKLAELPNIEENAGHKLAAKMASAKCRDRHNRTRPY